MFATAARYERYYEERQKGDFLMAIAFTGTEDKN